jgi:hypothetical protein
MGVLRNTKWKVADHRSLLWLLHIAYFVSFGSAENFYRNMTISIREKYPHMPPNWEMKWGEEG